MYKKSNPCCSNVVLCCSVVVDQGHKPQLNCVCAAHNDKKNNTHIEKKHEETHNRELKSEKIKLDADDDGLRKLL